MSDVRGLQTGSPLATARYMVAQAAAWRVELALAGSVALAAAALMQHGAALPETGMRDTLLVFLVFCVLVLYRSPAEFLGTGPGPANRITLIRAALVAPVVTAALHPVPPGAEGWYWLIAVAACALALDALDGAVARRRGWASAFGARFDMELDAFLILVLAVLVWRSGQAGAWVLLIGLMRYLFVAVAWRWPWLNRELAPSRRRQAICVVQSVALLLALAPALRPPLASVVALAALAFLVYSFVVDIVWLHRHRQPQGGKGL